MNNNAYLVFPALTPNTLVFGQQNISPPEDDPKALADQIGR